MPVFPRGMLAVAVLAVASPLTAQETPKPAESNEVVVTARRNPASEVHDFIGALTQAPPSGQLSRFETRAACPTTVGVTPGQRDAIIARMRVVAAAAGVPLAEAGCTPNILVIVTADKTAFLKLLIRKHPYYIGGMSSRDTRKLIADPAPAVAWQIAGPQLNADGIEVYVDAEGTAYNQTGRAASRIGLPARPHFAAAVVVVEARALDGLTTIQLADYAAMRTFARTDPARLDASGAPTILKILDAPMGSAVPLTLTMWDLGFLRALYTAPENVTAAQQRSAMRKTLTGALVAPSRSAEK